MLITSSSHFEPEADVARVLILENSPCRPRPDRTSPSRTLRASLASPRPCLADCLRRTITTTRTPWPRHDLSGCADPSHRPKLGMRHGRFEMPGLSPAPLGLPILLTWVATSLFDIPSVRVVDS